MEYFIEILEIPKNWFKILMILNYFIGNCKIFRENIEDDQSVH